MTGLAQHLILTNPRPGEVKSPTMRLGTENLVNTLEAYQPVTGHHRSLPGSSPRAPRFVTHLA